ncbi:SCO family protein [Halorhodospira abdelmalekii]|uniref:SCO family protein n=1 Tax=Halorhodospira abdelmalekii TaxID=421629 RepID=UPI001903E7E9|nr:SCO family protein [Halorhodospira abdelmalekii]
MTRKRARILLWTALAVAAVVAALASLWLVIYTIGAPASPPEIRGTYLEEGRPIADFELTDHDGRPFTPERLSGQWSLLTFGYTGCTDATPEMLELLTFTHRLLEETRVARRLQLVLISVDSQHDTPPRLADYAPRFHDELIALTGEPEQISTLAQSLGIRYTPIDGNGAPAYRIEPVATVLLIDPRGRLLALFRPPHHPQLLAEDLYELAQYHRRQQWIERLAPP